MAEIWIIDILPQRVPAENAARYFAFERYAVSGGRLAALYGRFARLVMKLNCYFGMELYLGCGGEAEPDPAPDELERVFAECAEPGGSIPGLRAEFNGGAGALELDGGDHYMALFSPSAELLELVKRLAAAEGLCVWKSETENE